MASLCFSNEHMAWQQRIGKELTSIQKFYRQSLPSNYDSFRNNTPLSNNNRAYTNYRPKRDTLGLFTPVRSKSVMQGAKQPDQFIPLDINSHNVYAEVRGKYARPPPPLNRTSKEQSVVLTPSSNPVIKRPSTAGSLNRITRERLPSRQSRPKSNTGSRGIMVETKTELPAIEGQENLVKSMDRQLISSARSVRSSHQKKVQEEGVKKQLTFDETKLPHVDILNLEEQEKEEKEKEQDEIPDDVSVADSQQSWITTSSHRRYIEELERIIKEERMVIYKQRRIKAESMLKDITTSNRQEQQYKISRKKDY